MEPHDPVGRERLGRILTLVGDLLREMGALVPEAAPRQPALMGAAGAAPEPEAVPEAVPVPEVVPAPEAVSPVPGPSPAAEIPGVGRDGAADEPLFLVCEASQGRLALPWNWVAGTHVSASGAPEAFTITDGETRHRLHVQGVLGLWTRAEVEASGEAVHWLREPQELALPATPAPPARAPRSPERPPIERLRPVVIEQPGEPEPIASPAGPVWVASPSALARRFLMRHLSDLGFEVREARDLDDPLLPADQKGVAALFLDESLLEEWTARPTGHLSELPLVLLTVDGELSVPPDGERPSQGAVLPRPFERSEVERVAHWLRSLAVGESPGGSREDGDEEDDTWLFADPFGASRAGEHSRR